MLASCVLEYGNSKEREIIRKEAQERFQYIYESAFDLVLDDEKTLIKMT